MNKFQISKLQINNKSTVFEYCVLRRVWGDLNSPFNKFMRVGINLKKGPNIN